MELKGSKTEANLLAAFAGESQARNKYTYYASKAKKEGYEQIAAIFEETAGNEKEHAKIWFKELHNGSVPSTIENLKDAAAGENYEWTDMYATFAKEAKEEGFDRIAKLFIFLSFNLEISSTNTFLVFIFSFIILFNLIIISNFSLIASSIFPSTSLILIM